MKGVDVARNGCGLGTFINREDRKNNTKRKNCEYEYIPTKRPCLWVVTIKNVEAGLILGLVIGLLAGSLAGRR